MTGALLPNGKQQFIDINGKPLVNGTVGMYFPATLVKKSTWQDQDETVLNTNPIVLDSRGQATIWGGGSYRQILKDATGNLIWDKIVSVSTFPDVPVYTPQMFGAIGDYIVNGAINPHPTDNLAAFEACAAQTGQMYIPNGYYYFSAPWTPPRLLEVFALGPLVYLIGQTNCMYSPLGNDGIRIKGVRFDSVTKGVAVNFGTGVPDYSSDNRFEECVFGNSLSFATNGPTQSTVFTDCSFQAPLYIPDGNYTKTLFCDHILSDITTARATIAGIPIGTVGSGYFVQPAFQQDSGHDIFSQSCRYEHIPNGAVLLGSQVISFCWIGMNVERCTNAVNSTALSTGGWIFYVDDSANTLANGSVISPNVIGNVTFGANVSKGVFGGTGIKKTSISSPSLTFFETASQPGGGWQSVQYPPKVYLPISAGGYTNTGVYSIAQSERVGPAGAVSATNGASQTFTTGVATKVAVDTVSFDTDNWFVTASNRYSQKLNGIVRLGGIVRLTAVAAGVSATMSIYQNGSLRLQIARYVTPAIGEIFLEGGGLFSGSAGDYWELFVTQNSGGNLDSLAIANAMTFTGSFVGS
jgi:hypothetical protein